MDSSPGCSFLEEVTTKAEAGRTSARRREADRASDGIEFGRLVQEDDSASEVSRGRALDKRRRTN